MKKSMEKAPEEGAFKENQLIEGGYMTNASFSSSSCID